MIHIHVWRVYLWCVFVISLSLILILGFRFGALLLMTRCSHLVVVLFFCCVFYFLFVSLCIITIHKYHNSAWHYRISCYFIVSVFLSTSFFVVVVVVFVVSALKLASNISYLIILMCLIVCLKVHHLTGALLRARLLKKIQSGRYVHRHSKFLTDKMRFYSKLVSVFNGNVYYLF